MSIEKVAIVGAGAVGAYFIAGLSEKLGDNLCLVAKGERKLHLEQQGLIINEKNYELPVKTPEEAKDADLIIVAVKYGALQGILEDLKTMVRPETIIISPMNGVDSEEIIGNAVGIEHLVYTMIKISAERIENKIAYDPKVTPGLYYGAVKDESQQHFMVKELETLFADTPVGMNFCTDILQAIWYKYALNISRNLPQAMIGVGFGAYFTSEYVIRLSEMLCDEVVAVAKAKGIDISDRNNAMGKNVVINPKARFSTLQDLDAKRHTEIDMFSGTLIRLGKELGVPTPYNEVVYLTIKALEEKNDGKI